MRRRNKNNINMISNKCNKIYKDVNKEFENDLSENLLIELDDLFTEMQNKHCNELTGYINELYKDDINMEKIIEISSRAFKTMGNVIHIDAENNSIKAKEIMKESFPLVIKYSRKHIQYVHDIYYQAYNSTGVSKFKVDGEFKIKTMQHKVMTILRIAVDGVLESLLDLTVDFIRAYRDRLSLLGVSEQIVFERDKDDTKVLEQHKRLFGESVYNFNYKDTRSGEVYKLQRESIESNDPILETIETSKIFSYRKLNKLAEDNDFICVRQKGDHAQFKRQDGSLVTIPQGRLIGKGLSIQIQKQIQQSSRDSNY